MTDRTKQLVYQNIFERVYSENLCGMGSGVGSQRSSATQIRSFTETFLRRTGIRSMVDYGCGDWQYMRSVSLPQGFEYLGVDVVPDLIERNRRDYGSSSIRFAHIGSDLAEQARNPLLRADLVHTKHVLQHWHDAAVQDFVREIVPNYAYALITEAAWCGEGRSAEIPTVEELATNPGVCGNIDFLSDAFVWPVGSRIRRLFFYNHYEGLEDLYRSSDTSSLGSISFNLSAVYFWERNPGRFDDEIDALLLAQDKVNRSNPNSEFFLEDLCEML